MSKHNYSQYSNKKKNYNEMNRKNTSVSDVAIATNNTTMCFEPTRASDRVIPISEVKMEVNNNASELKLVRESVDTVPLPKTVEGVVVNCLKLNVRTEPRIDADVVCVLDVMSEIKIDVSKSTTEWFKIYTAIGAEGYCMRKFVDAHL